MKTSFTGRLRPILLAISFIAAAPAAGFTACTDLENMSPADLSGTPVATVQAGLRVALQDNNRLLRDNFLGRYTKNALAQLCDIVPRSGGVPDVPGTLELSREYAALTALVPQWRAAIGRPLTEPLLQQIDARRATGREITLPLRLAGTPEMTAAVLQDRQDLFGCDGAEAALAATDTAREGAERIRQLYGFTSATQLCEALPVAGTADDFAGAMARLNRIDAALTGALRDLQSEAFARWIAGNSESYRLRLVGTETAVLRLIEEFRALQKPGSPTPEPSEPPLFATTPCSPKETDSTLTYYALSGEEIDSLGDFTNISPLLLSFREQNQGFDSPDALWRSLQDTLRPAIDSCVLEMVGQVVLDSSDLARAYHLDPQQTDNLIVTPSVQPVMPVLQGFRDIQTRTEDELLQGIRAALTTETGKAVNAEVEQAADIMAAASEPEEVFYDIAPDGVPVPELPPAVPRVVVTGATDDALVDSIANEQFRKVLAETEFAPATSRDLIKSQVRGSLRGAAAVQTADQVDALMADITPAVVSGWSLTPELEQAILSVPYIAEAGSDATASNLPERLKTLAGIEYPSLRLFAEALKGVPAPDGVFSASALSDFMTDRIVMKAEKTVADPGAARSYGALQVPDCDCVPERAEHAEVYGFYPFWNAPVAGAAPPADPADPAAPDAVANVAATSQELVDFSVFSRVAFYGLELTLSPPEAGGSARALDLRNEAQWAAARRSFVNSAHRFRAKADIAIDLRDWKDWSDANIDDAADSITAQMAPFDRFEGYSWAQIGAAIPTLFDRPQPDGVTLIFHDHPGTKLPPEQACRVTQLIARVYQSLPDPKRQTINLGFDFSFPFRDTEKWEQPLFDELGQLLVPSDHGLGSLGRRQCDRINTVSDTVPAPDYAPAPTGGEKNLKIVDKLLIFLERPTRDTSQMLRYQMDVSQFSGETLMDALRSIIPVLPPGAHEFVYTPGKKERPYDQFGHDVSYFEDNFGGIGFWPVPRIQTADAANVQKIVSDKLNVSPATGSIFEAPAARVCGFVCPNRAYVSLSAMALFAAVIILTWRSFYNGIVDRIAFRVLMIGAVWIGNIVLIAILFLLTACDSRAYVPKWCLFLLIGVLGLVLIYNFVQRVKNGPQP